MSLVAGTRLGAYEILGSIGTGGMGAVYRARDSRLDRIVAIKVVLPTLSADTAYRQRFRREARTVAALAHPHICPIFDVGTQDDLDYLVMEYLEGETLASRLARGALSMAAALQHAIEISDALAYAHRRWVVHRDLKPGNILLTKSGAMLLDFGLARQAPRMGRPEVATMSAGLTGQGTFVGTVQYMAPEQLEGKEVDARSDVFALGAVIYEMFTGRKAFDASSHASAIAAVLEHDPVPMPALRPDIDPALERLVKKCLVKDPEIRWQDALDVRHELEWLRDPIVAGAGQTAERPSRLRTLAPWLLVATLALACLALVATGTQKTRETVPPLKFIIPIPSGASVPVESVPTLSPDGTRIVVSAVDSRGRRSLLLHSLERGVTERLAGGDDGEAPFWSPDGRYLAFYADGNLRRLDAQGGIPQTICPAPGLWGPGAWLADDQLLFTTGSMGVLQRVSAAGGQPSQLLTLNATIGESAQLYPRALPDNRHFIYFSTGRRNGIYLSSIDATVPRLVAQADTCAVFAPPGYLLFARGGEFWAQPFDDRRFVPLGEPVRWSTGVSVVLNSFLKLSASRTGVLAFSSVQSPPQQLAWYDRTGHRIAAIGEPARDEVNIDLSHDGRYVLVWNGEMHPGTGDLWMLDTSTAVRTRLTFGKGDDADAVWSPDGRALVFASFRQRPVFDLFLKTTDGAEERPLFVSDENKYPKQWLSDGSILFLNQNGRTVFLLPVDGRSGKPRKLMEDPFDKDNVRVSPDLRRVAFNSLESGQWEVYVADFPSFANKRRVSVAGGAQPKWRDDGAELYYLTLTGMLMHVEVKLGAAFDVGAPRPLFTIPVRVDPVHSQYAVTSGGRRFLVQEPTGLEEPLHVVVNWPAALLGKPSSTGSSAGP